MKMQDPKLPSLEEEREHMLTHLPYRSWCVHCVRGKGRAMDHRRQGDSERRVPEVHLDYCFLGSAVDARPKTVLVAKDRESRMVTASLVPSKGASNELAAKRVRAFLRELGYEHMDVIIKTDQEAAIKDVLNEVCKIRMAVKTFREESPVGASASNGVIERGNQTVEGQIRVLKNALEERILMKKPGDPVLSWLVEFAQ